MTTMTTSRAGRNEPRREALLSDFTLRPVTDEERRRARLAVCARSADATEARELLEALGLI
jgi:hypothetical protein